MMAVNLDPRPFGEALPPLPDGTEIGGGLRIEKVLGRGSFGVTYQVRDPKTGGRFALKEFAPRDLASRDAQRRLVALPRYRDDYRLGLAAFCKEAEFLRANSRHPSIVEVRGLFMKHATAYMLMELVDGAPLKTYVDRQTPLNQEQLIRLFSGIARGLSHLHDRMALHRDLKPANIMIRRNGDPVLIDFGAARRIIPGVERTQIFTLAYAAIEQFDRQTNSRLKEGPWTDIFAMGTIAHELASGRRPPDAKQRADAIAMGQPDPYPACALRARDGFSTRFCDAVDWACRFFPDERPSIAGEWIEALRGTTEARGHNRHRAWGKAPHMTQKNVREVAAVLIAGPLRPLEVGAADQNRETGAAEAAPASPLDDAASVSTPEDDGSVRPQVYLVAAFLVIVGALIGLLVF